MTWRGFMRQAIAAGGALGPNVTSRGGGRGVGRGRGHSTADLDLVVENDDAKDAYVSDDDEEEDAAATAGRRGSDPTTAAAAGAGGFEEDEDLEDDEDDEEEEEDEAWAEQRVAMLEAWPAGFQCLQRHSSLCKPSCLEVKCHGVTWRAVYPSAPGRRRWNSCAWPCLSWKRKTRRSRRMFGRRCRARWRIC